MVESVTQNKQNLVDRLLREGTASFALAWDFSFLYIDTAIYNWKYTISNSLVDGTKGEIFVADDFIYNVRL